MTGQPLVTLRTGDPGPAVGTLGPGGVITWTGDASAWATGGTRQVIGVSRVWDAACGGQVVCETPLLDGREVRLCGDCPSCRARAGETIPDTVRAETMPPSPDCQAGKHGSCTGDAWDADADALTACPCTCHQEVR